MIRPSSPVTLLPAGSSALVDLERREPSGKAITNIPAG